MGLDENLLRAKLTYILNLTTMNEQTKILTELKDLLEKSMLTREALEELTGNLATRDEVAELSSLINDFIDEMKHTYEELLIPADQVNRMEDWIIEASSKIGLPYEPFTSGSEK